MLTKEAKSDLVRAFVAPVTMTWARQLFQDLAADFRPPELPEEDAPLFAAMLSITGTLEGHVLYFFSEDTAGHVAREFQSKPRAPGGDPSLAAIDDVMKMVASNSRFLMTKAGHSCDVNLVKVFPTQGTSLTGVERWTGAATLTSQGGLGPLAAAVEVLVFVDIGEPGQPHAVDYSAIEKASAKQGRFAPGTALARGVMSSSTPITPAAAAPTQTAAPRPTPPPSRQAESSVASHGGVHKIEQLDVTVLRAQRVEVVDARGEPRAVMSTLQDGSPSIILSDEDGRMRAVVVLPRQGQPRMMFIDELGQRIWEAPEGGRQEVAERPPEGAQPADRSPRRARTSAKSRADSKTARPARRSRTSASRRDN